MRRILAASLLAALTLTACGGQDTSGPADAGDSTDRSHDVSGVQKVDEIAALLPAAVADKGTLVVGAAVDYAPAEFRADDLQTAIGYDVDLSKALGKVLGLEAEVVDGEFASLLAGMGSKYDIGISSFTITPERTASYNMISYITVGSSFAVKKGNPDGLNPDDVCGKAIGVQTGTWQEEELGMFNEECSAAGKEAIEVLSYPRQSDVTTNVVGGKADAFYADSTVASYSVAITGDQLEVVGDVRDAAPQGIVVPQDDAALTEAVQKAMQHLMDDGTWQAILDSWGVDEAALDTAELNPEG
ncbi:ABC transporter substrate-binding protein [Tessaracoccus sp. ZS01]|uniref:ABC transporter substrate-binding protein n=1 Tax=Tessaracoccus sp. ZS01 TaxID=1906324 RepID=UPI00096D0509|nr:ABC transporter substrate-binding protein [Tessaracoccus sp. ZS01]MCG6567236.1 ABC transporter substrate-binding protein [Tessaracoccus sp. ZS01]OMG57201.1 ABC transporter substrate-binding protein [Tessaracoccus sp. ZS01]